MTDTKTTPKKETKKTPKIIGEKKTLLELVQECDLKQSQITLELSRVNLLKQLEYETRTNEYVEPSLTPSEFDKIMNGGKL